MILQVLSQIMQGNNLDAFDDELLWQPFFSDQVAAAGASPPQRH